MNNSNRNISQRDSKKRRNSKCKYDNDYDSELENSDEETKDKNLEYVSTNLICKPNLYINEIELSQPTLEQIEERCLKIERRVRWQLFALKIIDPREEYRRESKNKTLMTMVDYDEVYDLTLKSLEMHL